MNYDPLEEGCLDTLKLFMAVFGILNLVALASVLALTIFAQLQPAHDLAAAQCNGPCPIFSPLPTTDLGEPRQYELRYMSDIEMAVIYKMCGGNLPLYAYEEQCGKEASLWISMLWVWIGGSIIMTAVVLRLEFTGRGFSK